VRDQFLNKQKYKTLIPYSEAIVTKEYFDWKKHQPTKPAVNGVKIFKAFDLATIARFIDWGPFFIGWEMPGKFPEVLEDKIFGVEATRLYNDAQKLLQQVIDEKWFVANGVIGFWPANSNNRDTIILQTEEGEVRLECLRQQMKKAIGQPCFSLADFIAPSPSPITSMLVEGRTKAPSRWEGENDGETLVEEETVGYRFADTSVYGLVKEYALKHRSQPTEAEEVLWKILKTKQLQGFKFRRQHIIDRFIADFVCLKRRLIIEIDGLIHNHPEHKINDKQRTERLDEIGFKLIRFTNEQVLHDTENTLHAIASALNNQPEISSLSDLSSPTGGQGADYMGAFAVSIQGARQHIDKFAAEYDEYNKIMVQILADRLVEAFAECLHQQVRKEYWGYEKTEALTNEQLIREEYKGIRPAPGYPACPDHTEKIKLFQLLSVTENIGIELTESLAMNPPASVCGWYFSHPQSHYFGLGKIGKDQLEDYAKRKRMTIEEAERWLRPVLE
jgi:5-methyltetrahydrofolate--homocysteine methyltransferase